MDFDDYEILLDYSHRATQYGYRYRLEYEKQVREHGEVIVKFSLVDPSNYLEWLAVSALGGITGSVAFELVKYVAKQIYQKLTSKKEPLSDSEKSVLKIVSDNATLNQFTIYIQNYHKGNAKTPKEAHDAVLEEEIIHSMTDDLKDEMIEAMEKLDKENFTEVFGEIFLKAAKEAGEKRRAKPKLSDLHNLLTELKGTIKMEKSNKRKVKKKKKR
tara:strand:+ start:322 stop:966 length:645 start_codon:yes stop_codon:yes gene_type:complete